MTTTDQSRTEASSRERSPDEQYSLPIEIVADLYAKAGHPRTHRAIQKYCALNKLDCHKVETETGEKYLVAPYSVARHLAFINELRTNAISRDQTRMDANVRPLENNGEPEPRIAANTPEQSRTDATVPPHLEKYIIGLERENEFLRNQIQTKDKQIAEGSERARETNVLIAGLQKMLTPLLGNPKERRDDAQERPDQIPHSPQT